jgi:hypothetical protein
MKHTVTAHRLDGQGSIPGPQTKFNSSVLHEVLQTKLIFVEV